ncbi:MAG: SpoIIE family protein phosphatase [Anaerolineae bacterium]
MQVQEETLELELQVGAAKVSKYAVRESGDTLEMIERPHGGLSLVLVDGQQSGQSAKRISNLVARKAISLLAEGVRDGAAARATHDYLRTYRQGQISAELSMVSLDLVTRTLVISRNSHCPVLLLDKEGWQTLDEPSQPIGIYAGTKPSITEIPIAANIWVIAFTDGVLHAGRRFGTSFDALTHAASLVKENQCTAPTLADALLAHAIELDHGRPQDDMSVLVLALVPRKAMDNIRRLAVRFPLPPL